MSIMDAFRNAFTPNSGTQGVDPNASRMNPNGGANPGQLPNPDPSKSSAPGTGDIPAGTPGASGTPDPSKSPLDEFLKLWDNDPNAASGTQKPLFNLDPAKLQEAAASIDYTTAVTPEQLTSIAKGGEEGMRAFMAAMQSVAATTLTQSAITTGKMVEAAVTRTRADVMKEIPGLVKNHSVRDTTFTNNPALQHPAIKPLVTAFQAQLQVKFPSATGAELQDMTNKYFDNVGKAFGSKGGSGSSSSSTPGASSAADEDWEAFLK